MKRNVLFFTAALAALPAGFSQAAELAITPEGISMTIPAGASGATTVLGSLDYPPPAPYVIRFQLQPAGGNMSPSWLPLITQPTPAAVITNGSGSHLIPISIRVPATAAPGTYLARVRPIAMISSIAPLPSRRLLDLLVTVPSTCPSPPTVSITATQPGEFKAPNNKLEDVSVSGTIALPAGCTLGRAWYTLADEYGVFGKTEDLAPGAGGTFSLTTAVLLSRRGDDRDGRVYQITVHAADEAGTGAAAPVTLVVRHDQRGGR